tara:strand:- start:3831 stop:4643 length:813 start_codon:yes stop_codon:yes gene_type:complete
MELPNDIWAIIVKQSKKSNNEFIKEKNLDELFELEKAINEKKNKIYNTIKSKLNKYDIIKVTHKTDENAYNCDLLVTNLNLKNKNKISVSNLNKGIEKCIFGNYKDGDIISFQIDLNYCNIEVISSLADRNKENIKIANSLKVGDVFVYSNYTSTEWVRYRFTYTDLSSFENGCRYGIVNEITPNKIVMLKYYTISNTNDILMSIKYINKNMVLNKINYEDNEVEYIKLKKKFMFMCMLEINKINDNNDYFKDMNKKQIIKLQKFLKIRR